MILSFINSLIAKFFDLYQPLNQDIHYIYTFVFILCITVCKFPVSQTKANSYALTADPLATIEFIFTLL